MWPRIAIAAAVVLGIGSVALRGQAVNAPQPTLRVLFVGNSYTRFNNLPRMVRKLAEAEPAAPRIQTELSAHGGRQLRGHYREGDALRRLRSRWPTHLVLQPHSMEPLTQPARLSEYAARFRQAADRAGAELVLFETWPRSRRSRLYRAGEFGRTPEEMQARLDAVLSPLAAELSLRVAPVGRAFLHVMSDEMPVPLHRADGTHPTEAGTYLAACVLYHTLTGRSPIGLRYRPYPMRRGTAAALQRAAAEVTLPPAAPGELERP